MSTISRSSVRGSKTSRTRPASTFAILSANHMTRIHLVSWRNLCVREWQNLKHKLWLTIIQASITEEITDLFDDDNDDSPLWWQAPCVKDALTVTKKQGAADEWLALLQAHVFHGDLQGFSHKDRACCCNHCTFWHVPWQPFEVSSPGWGRVARNSSFCCSGQPIPWTWECYITSWRTSLASLPKTLTYMMFGSALGLVRCPGFDACIRAGGFEFHLPHPSLLQNQQHWATW